MMEGKLTIDGREVPSSENVALRRDGSGWVLYRNGRRVTKAWSVELKIEQLADGHGGNGNTAD